MESSENYEKFELSREEIKAARKLRKQQKKEAVRAEKQAQRASATIHSSKQESLSVISKDLFDKINLNTPKTVKTKRTIVTNLEELHCCNALHHNPIEIHNLQPTNSNLVVNKLDKSQPMLNRGKHSDKPKAKQISHLKRQIIAARKTDEASYIYVNNTITGNLETLASSFIQQMVGLHEKYFKRAPAKAVIKKRYVVGFHQLKKYLLMNKIHLFIIAVDIKLFYKDPLHLIIEDLISIAKANDISYVFVLKKRQLGKLTLKSVPVSCFGVLNYDGLNNEFCELLEVIKSCKTDE